MWLGNIICHRRKDGPKRETEGWMDGWMEAWMHGKTDKPDKLQGITPCVNATRSYRVLTPCVKKRCGDGRKCATAKIVHRIDVKRLSKARTIREDFLVLRKLRKTVGYWKKRSEASPRWTTMNHEIEWLFTRSQLRHRNIWKRSPKGMIMIDSMCFSIVSDWVSSLNFLIKVVASAVSHGGLQSLLFLDLKRGIY